MTSNRGHVARFISAGDVSVQAKPVLANFVSNELANSTWSAAGDDYLTLNLPAATDETTFTLFHYRHEMGAELSSLSTLVDQASVDLSSLMNGGPRRWPQQLTTQVIKGNDDGPFAVDVLTRPEKNPWDCRIRMTGVDFFEDQNMAAVSTWDGSVFLVSGLLSSSGELTWNRIASGLFQPLGVKIIDEQIFVTCRDQLVRLHDLNGDTEIDYYECFNNDHQVTDHFHEFAMGLQTDDEGNFYYAKSARHALPALVPHHGTLIKVSKDGKQTEIVANGFRAANGVCINDDGSFFVTDQEGHWTPKNRINWVMPGGFYGNMLGYHDVQDESNEAMEQPLVWITNQMDRSPGELMWVDSEKWGSLNGSLLNLSYGTGKIFLVPHEEVEGQLQGGVIELPIPMFPTGVMRGRFNPGDDHLYCCGMFAWSSNRQQPGGFYRLRATGKDAHLPIELNSSSNTLTLTFSNDLDRASAINVDNWSIKQWQLSRSRNYGSDHIDEQALDVRSIKLLGGNQVELTFGDLAPTMCMEIRYSLESKSGEPIRGTIHNTIHEVGK